MTTALARELTQGIRDEVEDLSEVFKKMAILKPDIDFSQANLWELPEITDTAVADLEDTADIASLI
jgi:hypothetical protein